MRSAALTRTKARIASTLAIVGLLSAGLVVGGNASAAVPGVAVLSIQQFGPNSSGGYDIVGEIQNQGSSIVGTIRVDFSFFDANNRLLSTDFTYARVDRLATGEKSPFSLSFDPVAGYDHFEYALSDQAFGALNHNFEIAVTNRYNDGFDHIVGTIKNNNTTTAKFVEIVGTGYGADGKAVKDGRTFVNNSSTELAPGTSATFDLILFENRPYSTFALIGQSPTAPSPAQGSSPSPSSSPTSGPTSGPASPTNQTPSVVVNPSLVRFGQTANVTINGSPGATVDLYVRKYLGNFTKIRDGLQLNSAGQAFVPTKPDMNLRFQAFDRTVEQGSSLAGANGLMTVEKNITLNARRDAVKRYTFTGSVNPTHPGATVSLFRNGSLLRSGIPVNASRVYSFTTTLPAGTYTFQVRSGSTGYNAASASPNRSVRIF